MQDKRSKAKALGDRYFFTGRQCCNGHIDKRHTSSGSCVTCSNARVAAKRKTRTPEQVMWDETKKRAKERNWPFHLEVSDIVIPSHCPVFGTPLVLRDGSKVRTGQRPSIDRINSLKGYYPDNICVISDRANRIKNDATLEEIDAIAVYMRKYTQHIGVKHGHSF